MTRARHTTRPSLWQRFARNRLALAGGVVVAIIILAAVFAPILPLMDPDATDLGNRLRRPLEGGSVLGTDQLGRDILSRLVWGTRISLAVGLFATAVAAVVGSLIGLLAAFFGKLTDTLLMRSIDVLMAFPYLLLALAIVAALGPGLTNALIAIAIVNVPFFARAVRGVAINLRNMDFVDAARLGGAGWGRILFNEILPNVIPTIVVLMATTLGWMVLETAGLSFLGLGAQPPQADLGSMLGDGRQLLTTAPHVATIPGALILVIVAAVNVMSDGLRDVLDPRFAGTASAGVTADARVEPARDDGEPDAARFEARRPILTVQDLKTYFMTDDVYRAVDGVSFAIEPREAVGIVGESGCGKTVTAHSILGIVPQPPGRIVSGSIRFDNDDLVKADPEVLRRLRGHRITYIPQDPMSALNPVLTVGEQLTEVMTEHGTATAQEARDRALRLMEQVQLQDPEHLFDGYAHELSGGMRQRVMIAAALMNDPDLLIADEPTTALDVTIQAEILELLDDLRRDRNMALIFITHDLGIVSALCDRVLVMYAGKIVESASTAAIFEDPRHPYTRRLIASVPVIGEPERALQAIPGLPPPVNDFPRGCRFAPRCAFVLDDCRQPPIQLESVSAHHLARCIRAGEDMLKGPVS